MEEQSGKLFHDQLGLNEYRTKLNYYPNHVWLYLMASSWQRIGQEEHLAARCMITGQETGFSIIASRLVKDIMQLGFLLEGKYFPYAKWLEMSFAQLNCPKVLMPYLSKIINSSNSKLKQENLCKSFEYLASRHNELSITKSVNSECGHWHNRPFKAIHGELIAEIIVESINNKEVQAITKRGLLGNIDQISDNTDIVENVSIRRKLIRSVYSK